MTSPDTNTLNGSLEQLGITMADNLVSMGVTGAAASDGLTTLAGKILDIEPSIGGLDLDTAITLSASSSSIISGQSVIFTSKLTASYDDETVTDVDLSGVLTGATVVFYDLNGVSVGSGVTDSNGVATATVSNLALGSHTIKAVFEGTDNFHYADSSTVSVTVTNPAPDSMTLVKSAGKQILSYKDVSGGDEFCTVTATVYDANNNPLAGETVTFEIAGSTVKSDVTDVNGQISYTYGSSGVGDVTISAACGLLSETYDIEDCTYYNPNQYSTSAPSLNVPLPSAPFLLEYKIYQGDRNYSMPYLDIGDSSNNRMLVGQYVKTGTNGIIIYKGSQTNHPYNTSVSTGTVHTISFSYTGSEYQYKLDNGNVMTISDANVTMTKLIHMETVTYGANYLKEIKVKPL